MRTDPRYCKDRRAFLQRVAATSVLALGGGLAPLRAGAAVASVTRPVLADLALLGGPDFRHLLPPAYDSATGGFGYRYWEARARAHGLPYSASAYQSRWENDFFHCESAAGVEFGILKSCGWLYDMWLAGHVAFVPNSFGGTSRDHEHCTLVLDQGNLSSGPNDHGRAGWGGRLAKTLGTGVTSLTDTPRPFCAGPVDGDIEASTDLDVISAGDTRRMGLFSPEKDERSQWSKRARLARALNSLYAARDASMPIGHPARRVVDLERKTRLFGDAMNDRLASVPVPAELAALYSGAAPLLRNTGFGRQMRNLYDALACNDILDLRIASLEYSGWDTHKDQRGDIEGKLSDLFGRGAGLSRLYQVLPADARANLVLVIAGEFGRQIRDNGDQGTDHGLGNTVMVIGEPVRGGVFGTMFPQSELAKLDDDWSPDIDGLNAFDHSFGRVADWMMSGAGSLVFPDRASRPKEAGLDFSTMFA